MDAPRAKLDRAREHLRALRTEVDAFLNADAYATPRSVDPENGDYIWRESGRPIASKDNPLHLMESVLVRWLIHLRLDDGIGIVSTPGELSASLIISEGSC